MPGYKVISTAREPKTSVGIWVYVNIHITHLNGTEEVLIDTAGFYALNRGLEEPLWTIKPFSVNGLPDYQAFFFFFKEEADAALSISCSKSRAMQHSFS